MNRDDANRELNRLVAHYRALPFDELLVLADQPVIETETSAPDGLTTFVVDIRHSEQDSVRIDVSAFDNNWFKLERLDRRWRIIRFAALDRLFGSADSFGKLFGVTMLVGYGEKRS